MDTKFEITLFHLDDNIISESIFPIPMICLFIGSSGSGKTNLLSNIIIKYWIPFENLYIFTKNIKQLIYEKMKNVFDGVDDVETYISNEEIVSVDDCESDSLVVFDDYVLDKQDRIKDYFIRSRSKNISCIYIRQNYSLLDLKAIRTNCNFLIIFKQSGFYIGRIWKDFLSNDIAFDKFKSLCSTCWKNKFGFISIDLTDTFIIDLKKYEFRY